MKSGQSWQYRFVFNFFRLSWVNVYIFDFEQGLTSGEYDKYTLPVLNLNFQKW